MPHSPIYNEQELLQKIAEGDTKAFSEILSCYHVAIYQAALRLCRDQWIAEEVVQDVFLKVWLKRGQLTGIEHFRAWLHTIAENITLDAIKKAARKKNDVASWVGDVYTADNDSTLEESYFEDLLQKAVQTLSPRQREAFMLVKEQGYKREEAATLMNVSAETVKTHLEQAMRAVRAYCKSRADNPTGIVITSIALLKYF